jgi:hypothetical protein
MTNPKIRSRLLTLQVMALFVSSTAFMSHPSTRRRSKDSTEVLRKGVGGMGEEGKAFQEGDLEKTYDRVATSPRADLIDQEAAMNEFFTSNEEWHPLFRNFATSRFVPAMSFLGSTTMDPNAPKVFDFDNTQAPWRRLDGIPTDESERQVLANVLDCMHASLINIPVDEATNEDDNDLQFLEEGRRMLALSRFHVLQGVTGGSVECYDALFSTCWSELMELRTINEASTGSLIVVPDYEISDLKRFTDMNLLRPLEWLGLQADFEITSIHRGSPAIRLLHKLQDMPEEPWKEDPVEE